MNRVSEPAELWLGETRLLRVQPGDVIVVRFDHLLDDQGYDRVAKHVKDTFPDHKVLLVESGGDITVARTVRPDPVPPGPPDYDG